MVSSATMGTMLVRAAHVLTGFTFALAVASAARGAVIGGRVPYVIVKDRRYTQPAVRRLVCACTFALITPLHVGITCTHPLATYRALRDGTPLPVTGWRP